MGGGGRLTSNILGPDSPVPTALAAAALWGNWHTRLIPLRRPSPPPPPPPSNPPLAPATVCTRCPILLAVAEPVDLVLAVKEGDSVAWAQKYAGRARVIAYNKGQQALGLSSVSEVALPNVGREAHAYLHHIGPPHRIDPAKPPSSAHSLAAP